MLYVLESRGANSQVPGSGYVRLRSFLIGGRTRSERVERRAAASRGELDASIVRRDTRGSLILIRKSLFSLGSRDQLASGVQRSDRVVYKRQIRSCSLSPEDLKYSAIFSFYAKRSFLFRILSLISTSKPMGDRLMRVF